MTDIPEMPTDPPESGTPRTDAAKWRSDSGIELVVAVLAKQLERELAEAITGREFACEEVRIRNEQLDQVLANRDGMLTRIGKLEESLKEIDSALYGETPTGYNPDRALTIRTMKELSAAANAREAALIAALNLASGQALEGMAREVALREALVDYKGRCRECGGSGVYLTEGSDEEPPDFRQCQWCDHALIALTQPAPPTSSRTATIDPGHPEAICQDCHGPNVVWHAPSPLWNAVVRTTENADPMLCPTCFIGRATAAGYDKDGWLVQPEFYEPVVPRALAVEMGNALKAFVAAEKSFIENTPEERKLPADEWSDWLTDAYKEAVTALAQWEEAKL